MKKQLLINSYNYNSRTYGIFVKVRRKLYCSIACLTGLLRRVQQVT